MANSYFYSNIAVPTTLSGNINNSVTSATVADTTGWPSSTPYVVALDYGAANEELVKVTANAAGTLTIQRGFSGTSAVAHSTGAAVRHVYNAQDATDFRTHEQATAAIHGVAGTLVGTTDSQTLTNKTLTAPAISAPVITGGGSLAGTFSGTPTFSGAITFSGGGALAGTFSGSPTFSGTPTLSAGAALAGTFTGTPTFSGVPAFTAGVTVSGGAVAMSRTAAANSAATAQVAGDTQQRLIVQADGLHLWGSGALAGDTNLYRATANTLKTDDSFTAVGAVSAVPTDTSLNGVNVNLPSGTVGDVANYQVNSALVAALDANGLFRNYGANTPTTFTPTVTNGGSVTWTVRTGIWWRIGKMIFVNMYLLVNAAGSGVTALSITGPVNIDRTIRQMMPLNVEGSSTVNGTFSLVAFTGGTLNTFDRVRTNDGGTMTGGDLSAGTLITVQGWYREA